MTDEVGEETDPWLRQRVKEGLVSGTMPKISEMLSFSKGFGVRIYACSAAVAFHKINREELTQTDEVMGISSFLEKVEGASILLYI